MMIVTAYPVLNAVWLSFYRLHLTAPDDQEFVGLQQLLDRADRPAVVERHGHHVHASPSSRVAVELVIGFAFAMVMHRAIFGRRTVRTAILIPYGIVTVVSAFAWRYAFDPTAGFVNQWFGPRQLNWFGDRWSSLFVIILAEIWKTTPFISLLLLAGLAQVPAVLQEAAEVDGATRLAAAVEGDHAEHEGGHHGRGAVPHARRVADLRQRVHHDGGRQQHRDAVVPDLPPDDHPD